MIYTATAVEGRTCPAWADRAAIMAMDVRWRLFARDVLCLQVGDTHDLRFGKPPRPVRGLRLLGVVVRKERATARSFSSGTPTFEKERLSGPAAAAPDGGNTTNGKRSRMYDAVGGSSVGGEGGGELGLLWVDDGTGVVEVRLPLRLWNAIALWDQVDVVGTPKRSLAPTSPSPPAPRAGAGGGASEPRLPGPEVWIKADGCFVENDPNVAILRALESITLYKTCYFSRSWSPTSTLLPPLLPDPTATGRVGGEATTTTRDGDVAVDGADGVGGAPSRGRPDEGEAGEDRGGRGGGGGGGGGGGAGAGACQTPSPEELLRLIGKMGGATGDELAAKLGLPSGHAEVISALDQMQLDGVIYLAGDRYMPL